MIRLECTMVRLKSRMAACALLALSAVFLCAPHVGGQIPCSYTVEYLPTLPPCWPSTVPRYIEPWDISPNGRYVCGWVGVCPSYAYQAIVVDTQTMEITFISIPAGVNEMRGHGVNDNMEVTGTMNLSNGLSRAFLFSAGDAINLGVPPGSTNSYGNALSNGGDVVGECNPGYKAFLWRDGSFTLLNLPVGPNSVANDVDEESRVVGFMGSSTSNAEAFVWDSGNATGLGVIPGGYAATAMAIAPNGTIAGYGWIPGGDYGYKRAFVYRNGIMVNIGALPGYVNLVGWDTNNWVTVGGCDNYPEPGEAAFRFSLAGLQSLESVQPDPNLRIFTAKAISDAGSIVVNAKLGASLVRAVLRPVFGPPGDANGTCTVGVADLLLVINEWGKANSSADVNNDGVVNVSDLLIVINNWGPA